MDNKISFGGAEKGYKEKIIDGLILGLEKRLGIKLVLGQLTKEEVKLSQGFM